MINAARVNGSTKASKNGLTANRVVAIRFTCTPGMMPVIIPSEIPHIKAMRIWMNMKCERRILFIMSHKVFSEGFRR